MSIESFNPKVSSVIIFDKGGALIEREGMVQLVKGMNTFRIEDIPASFDINQIQVELNCDDAYVQQIDIKKPVPEFVYEEIRTRQEVSRDIIDKSRRLPYKRQQLLELCESIYYSMYQDEFAEVKIWVDSKTEKTCSLKIKYILFDNRIYWEPRMVIDLTGEGAAVINVSATIINNTNFAYDSDIALAEFDLGLEIPPMPIDMSEGLPNPTPPSGQQTETRKASMRRSQAMNEMQNLKMVMR
ncbi:MAG: hypothetical protein WED07_14295 [Candidatus Freyarchaeum deiterrae]